MKEQDIRPKELFDRFLAASREDAEQLFADRSGFEIIACPACGDAASASSFEKLGFSYQECAGCGSLYVSPRPPAGLFDRFYRTSKASEFFAREFYRKTEEARRARMFRPRALFVAELASRFALSGAIADAGAGYGTFLEEVRATGAFTRHVAIEPGSELAAVCREKGFELVEAPVEQAGALGADLCTSFEVVEHVHDPTGFVRALGTAVRPGGIVMFTTLTVSGFDLQELWSRSKSIMPPHHINLLSTTGLSSLTMRAGLELVELSTPGQLDVDIVANAIADDPAVPVSRFARSIAGADAPARAAFQAFLQAHRLSSHVRVIARRPA